MNIDKDTALKNHALNRAESFKVKGLLSQYQDAVKNNNSVTAMFDSAFDTDNSETAGMQIPESLNKLLTTKAIMALNPDAQKEARQQIFDGISWGINEYQKRNGGEMPAPETVLAAFDSAVNSCTEFTKNPYVKQMFDKLDFSHHESLSVVPASIQVTIMSIIANALPLVAMLPNPTGSNEVPLIYGRSVANMRMGVFKKGDFIDGDKAGQPYVENRHTLIMEKSGATFTLDVHVGYDKEVNSDGTVKFKVDKTTPKAPFLGGRVVILVKGVEVANDANIRHETKSGISTLQPSKSGSINIDGKNYLLQTGTADLDAHSISVTFDTTSGNTEPEDNDVEVQVVFDYERKTDGDKYILSAPGMDMSFTFNSIFASPMRFKSNATIDTVTQIQNEFGFSWKASILAYGQQKYFLERNGRLLRELYRTCMADPKRVHTVDMQKNGVQYSIFADLFDAIRPSLGFVRSKLSEMLNLQIPKVSLFVNLNGAAFFNSLPNQSFSRTNVSYGDESSIYRLGTLNDGTDVYYVPRSLAVIDEADKKNTATMLMIANSNSPAKSQFVGHVAVAPMVVDSNTETYEEQVAMYSRAAAERNPDEELNNQGMVIQVTNLPSF